MSTPTSLQDLDNILAQAHASALRALAKAEQDLTNTTLQRDQLANRVQRLSLALHIGGSSDLHSNDDEAPAEIPASEVFSTPKKEVEPTPSPNRNLWDDVESILSGRRRAIRTTEILKKLIAMGWQDSESTKNNLANAFSRWTLQGKLERRGRGLYRLASGEVGTPMGDTAESTTVTKSTTVAITPVKNTPVMTAPVESTPTENIPAENTPAANTPKRNLWEDVQSILSGSGAVQTSDLFAKLVELGYPDSEAAKKNLHMATARWTRRGMLKKLGRGLYGLVTVSEVEAETEVVEAEDSKPIESFDIEETVPEPAPAKSSKDSLHTTPEPTTPQPEDLWEAVRKILRRGQPVKAAVIVDTLNKQGWDFKTGEDRDEVYEVLRAWSKQGYVLWGKAGVRVV